MTEHITVSIRITIVLLVIACGIYPLAIWVIGQTLFYDKANGSLITRNGKVIGSELIGQGFESEKFFHSRPSASGGEGYDASATGGTNLGPTSQKLRDSLSERIGAYADVRPAGGIPADAITASCSGVDPHISPQNAAAQAPRVARINNLPLARVEQMIAQHTGGRFLGIYGEPRVNVLKLNLAIEEAARR